MLENILIMGAPGSGKGTIAGMISDEYLLEHISAGELIRQAIKNKNSKITVYKESLNNGNLLPNNVVMNLIKDEFDKKGNFILDGFPRNVEQAEMLEKFFEKHNIVLSAVINLDVDTEIAKKRISGRRECKKCDAVYNIYFSPSEKENICDKCGSELYSREDDNQEAIEHRLNIYRKETASVEEFYRKKAMFVEIDGSGSPSETYSRVKNFLDSL